MFDYDEFYYSTVCHVCKTKSKSLKTCQACKLYRYCSVDHQRIHWPRHRPVCKIVNGLNWGRRDPERSPDRLRTKTDLKLALEKKLGRPLAGSENQVWMFPRICPVCLKKSNGKFVDCPKCPSASYCSDRHLQIHRRTHVKICEEMHKQYIYYCSLLQDEPKFYIQIDVNVPLCDIDKLFEKTHSKISNCDIIQLRNAERLSHAMTVLHALKLCNFLTNNRIQDTLTIHIIGATYEYDNFNRQIVELLFHWLANLVKINIIFIGPELQTNERDRWDFCNKCKDKKVNVCYEYANVLYLDFIKSGNYNIVPDIIGIFNCGFNEFTSSDDDPWLLSLPMLFVSNAPVLMTSYTIEEAVQDLEKLKANCNVESINILANCDRNKFHSPIPLRDWVNCDSVYYNNNYLSILRKE